MAPARALLATSEVRFNRFLALVYLVMAVGMAITAWVAQAVSTNEELMDGLVVIGALALYLDFINLFLLLLRTSRK